MSVLPGQSFTMADAWLICNRCAINGQEHILNTELHKITAQIKSHHLALDCTYLFPNPVNTPYLHIVFSHETNCELLLKYQERQLLND